MSTKTLKTIYLIRHGQADHNIDFHTNPEKACNIRDPALTETGKKQARGVQADPILFKALYEIDGCKKPEVCITSPLTRCLETATIGLEGFGIPYVACQHFQECADLPCDTGVPVPELAPRFPDVDFSELPDEWYSKCGHYNFLTHYQSAEGLRLLNQRMEAATEYLCSRPEDSIVVSAHHTVYCFLVGIEFANCEVMKMTLSSEGDWQSRWSVAESDGEVMPLYSPNGERWSWTGSGPVAGTLKTCLKLSALGPEAAKLSLAKRATAASLSMPPCNAPGDSAAILTGLAAVAVLTVIFIARQ